MVFMLLQLYFYAEINLDGTTSSRQKLKHSFKINAYKVKYDTLFLFSQVFLLNLIETLLFVVVFLK